MLTREIDPDTSLPKVHETRRVLADDPVRRQCTCEQHRCLWYALPRAPIGNLIHQLEASPVTSPWFPRHHVWAEDAPATLLCWKCGRAIKGWRPKLTPFGVPVTIGGQPAVHLALLNHYRAKVFRAYLPRLKDTVEFDALHCADCTLTAADGLQIVAIYLAGLLEAQRYGEALAEKLKLASAHHPDTIATYLSRWSGVEPIGPVDRQDQDPLWRS